MEVSADLREQVAVEIRPGVYRPDWSAVTKPRAREALGGRMAERAGLLDRWSHRLEADEDTVWRTTLLLYGGSGRSPSFGEIAVAAGILPDRVATIMRKLQSHDLVVLDTDSDSIRLAYPFTETATGHRVELNGKALHALCAIDALGVADMYSADISISSPCHHCGTPIEVRTSGEGRTLRNVAPVGAVVWYDFAYQGSAAASCCPAIVFFCSDAHLQQWLEFQTPRRDGIELTMDEALEVGRAIFGPVLADKTS